jgi:hypothetical protein
MGAPLMSSAEDLNKQAGLGVRWPPEDVQKRGFHEIFLMGFNGI